jgi:hypothetical protein
MAVHHPQYEEAVILPNDPGQHSVQQVQLTSTQSATNKSNDRSELQNGIVPSNWLSFRYKYFRVVRATSDDGMIPDN